MKTQRKEVHTRATETGWVNRAGTHTLSKHRRKDTAQAAGRKLAIERNADHVIHTKDGKIGRTSSY